MPVYTFSTPEKRPDQQQVVDKVKEHCFNKGMNFSAVVVKLIEQYHEQEIANAGRSKEA